MQGVIKSIFGVNGFNCNKVVKSSSGFTNDVYFVNDEFVVKLAKDIVKKKKLEKEISVYKKLNFDFIPNYVASGEFEGVTYLIVGKINGKGLFSVWHLLSDKERENSIKQIADILKSFNKLDAVGIGLDYDDSSWQTYWLKKFNEDVAKISEFGIAVSELENYGQRLNNLLTDNRYGLVYNDAHFDNFLYHNGKVSLIDFDRVRYCPIDYELMIFKTMCDFPLKFASEEDEKLIIPDTFKKIYFWFKKYYPEMFDIQNIDERVKLYQFDYLVNQAIGCKDVEWIRKVIKEFLY